MKRKWLCTMCITVALIMGLLTPGVALAAKPQTFTGSGIAYIAGPYVSWQTGPVEHAVNEPVNSYGGLTVTGWPAADGSMFESLHTGLIVLHRDGTWQGSLHGTFALIKDDGSRLEGNMQGKVVYDPVSDSIHDYGTFTSTGGTGIFAGVKARGTWEAFLYWTGDTYAGPIIIEGSSQ